jgi:hypothetical protein
MLKQITHEQIASTSADTLKASLYIRYGGNVVTYYPASMTADIQPNPSDPRTDLDTGAPVPEDWPVFKNVPIAWPRFGGFVLVGPLNQGDPVTLEAFDIDPTTWLAQGRSVRPIAPADVRRLSGAYWSATPTDLTGPIKSASAAAAAFLLGIDGDAAQILFKEGSIQLGATGGDAIALASKVLTQLQDIVQMVNGITVSVAAVGGPPIPVTVPPFTPSSVASALVKAQ